MIKMTSPPNRTMAGFFMQSLPNRLPRPFTPPANGESTMKRTEGWIIEVIYILHDVEKTQLQSHLQKIHQKNRNKKKTKQKPVNDFSRIPWRLKFRRVNVHQKTKKHHPVINAISWQNAIFQRTNIVRRGRGEGASSRKGLKSAHSTLWLKWFKILFHSW